MHADKLIVRCFAERRGHLWLAFCLDLSLACQADTLEEAKSKLDAQIREYIYDTLCGEDRQHEDLLLNRRAPTSLWVRYWAIRFLLWGAKRVHARHPRSLQSFKELLPLQPAAC